MRRLHLPVAAVALCLSLALPHTASAQAVTCKDGTTASQSGRGACSHHGGVAAVAITVSCRDGTTAHPGRGACSHHGGVGAATATKTRSSSRIHATESTEQPSSASASSDETVSCRDGTTSTGGQGACSHHGGVGAATEQSSAGNDSRSNDDGESVTCKDGTTSTGGRGACSHHGGVGAATEQSSAGNDSRSNDSRSNDDGESVTCKDGTTSTGGRGACSHHGGVEVAAEASAPTETQSAQEDAPRVRAPANAPAQASARCNDGTYSETKHRSGACSYHGGVQQWYKDLPVR
jgi:hypothetical protein